MKKVFGFLCLAILIMGISAIPACTAGDPVTDDLYITDIYGDDAHFNNITVGGVPVVPAGGDVVGTPPSVDNTIARYDGITGLLIQGSGVTIDDFDNLDTNGGDITGFDVSADNDVNITNDLDVGDDAIIRGDLDMNDGDVNNINNLNMKDPTTLTIAAGAITVTQGYHTVDTEGGASSDYLETINGGNIGDILTIAPANMTRDVIIRRTGNIRFKYKPINESFSFTSPVGSSGRYYAGGIYYAPAADANLTQAATSVNWGSANSAYGAKVFIVSKAAGIVAVGVGNVVAIKVTGTKYDPITGVRSAAYTETLVADITTMGANTFYQTTERYIGTVTIALSITGGAPATYSADFNYGFSKVASFAERTGYITRLNIKGRAGASDSGFNIRLLLHNGVGWTYSAAAFIPGAAVGSASEIFNMNTDYVTEKNLVNGEDFGYLRSGLMQAFDGISGEGFILEVTTGANKAVDTMTAQVFGHVITNRIPLGRLGSAIMFIFNGTNWMEL